MMRFIIFKREKISPLNEVSGSKHDHKVGFSCPDSNPLNFKFKGKDIVAIYLES